MAVDMTVTTETRTSEFEVRRLRHPYRTTAAVVVAIAAAGLAWTFATNPNLDWPTVGAYLFAELTLRGLAVTLYLTIISMVIGLVGGTTLAIMTLSSNWVLRVVAEGYITIFRGIPVLVQIIFWGFIGAFFPEISVGVPFTDIEFYSSPTSSLINSTTAAILALGLNEAAYAAEVVRAGIQSVDTGQREASAALGMSPSITMRRIILPQAMRVVVPPMGNEVITLLKTSALVSVIAGNDLMTNLQQVYAQNYKVIPLLVVASIWYLIVTSLLSLGQKQLERRFGRGLTPGLAAGSKRGAR